MARILVVEDEDVLGRNIQKSLRLDGHEVTWVDNGEAGVEQAARSEPDVVLLDLKLPRMSGMDVLRALRERGLDSAVVIMTAHGDIETAVTAMRQGAKDFLTKSGRLGELKLVIDRVLHERRLEESLRYFRERDRETGAVDRLLGDSPAMEQLRHQIRRLARSNALASDAPPSILITGETGTGKDMVARAIHYEGPRQAQPFVHVNCTAIPDDLFESELFGHRKGAFTDARASKKGLFEVAHGGTLFLDEIGHLPSPLQAKLLSAIENKSVRPVGAVAETIVDAHIIAATNRDLDRAVSDGEFRRDLFHRLRVVSIHLPPLRERIEDMDVLIPHFVTMHAQRMGVDVKAVTPEAMTLLKQHDWPGNVRELAHMIESIVLLLGGDTIHPEHLPLSPPQPEGGVDVQLGGREMINIDFVAGEPKLEEVELAIIRAALDYCKQNVSRTARLLGITRDALRYRLRKGEPEDK